ncbi:MAG: hypothetical protein QOI38_1314 [Sphingomonadales bacterium]|jgi:hypothetical protein|nr:hypothetical protein [Sphingomonadales bacterium]
MTPLPVDSSKWAAQTGVPAPPPLHLQHRRDSLRATPEQTRLLGWSFLLCISPAALGLAHLVVAYASRDWMSEGPLLAPFGLVIFCIGFLLCGLHGDLARPRWFACLAAALCAATIAAALAYATAGISALSSAAAGPPMRAQVARVERSGGRTLGSSATTFLLRDGSLAQARGYAPGYGRRRCFSVRRVSGRHGFSWLRIEAASPLPKAGGLAWSVSRETCFSGAELSTMVG